MMDPVQDSLAAYIRKLPLQAPKLRWISNVTGTWITAEEAVNAEYWTRHLRQTVRFADGISALVEAGNNVLLEVGPGSTLAGLARQHPATKTVAAVVATLGARREDASDLGAMLTALGELWVAGLTPEWRDGFYRHETRRVVALPTYPFERKRYWVEPGPGTFGFLPAQAADRVSIADALPSEDAAVEPAGSVAGAGDESETGSTLTRLLALFEKLSGIALRAENADDTFFELGFESLFLMQAARSIGQEFGVPIRFRQLREEFVTFAQLAEHLDRSADLAGGVRSSSPVAPAGEAPTERRLPLTEAQRELWYASQLGEAVSAAYHEQSTLRFTGPLDVRALRAALNQLAARHEALRTRFSPTGDLQIIAPHGELPLRICDFEGVSQTGLDEAAREEVERPFDLTAAPLVRATLWRLGGERHLLVLVVHHIICDGWSLGTLVNELGELYSAERDGRSSALGAIRSFSAYVEEQADLRSSAAYAQSAAFWRDQFSDSVPTLELPFDRVRPQKRSYAGGFVLRSINPELTAAIKAFCADRQCTVFTALLASFSVLLHRLSRQDALVVGVPSAGQVMGGLDHLVGHFANLLPVRSRMAGDESFAHHLDTISGRLNQVLEHWNYPFGALVQQLKVARDSSRTPIANVVFNSSQLRGTPNFAGLHVEALMTPKRFVNFDLNVNFAVQDESLVLGCYYSTELYNEATIQRWFGHFETLLRAIVASPQSKLQELPLLTADERKCLLQEWNDTAVPYRRDATIHQLFEEQVQRSPEAIALVADAQRISYFELNRRADALSARLRAQGVGPDVRVGVAVERSPELLVAILAILKAGGAFVPLDPEYPPPRIEFIVKDTGMPVLVTQRGLSGRWPLSGIKVLWVDDAAAVTSAGAAPLDPAKSASASNLAYVIYTSGSTGQPKGVCLEHRGVVALAAWASRNYEAAELNGVLFSTAATFDVSVFETLIPLMLGGKIVLAVNILELGSLAAASEVRLVSGVPSAVAQLLRSNALPESVATVNVAGEPCPQSLVDALYARSHVKRVIDVYGPTETTVYSTGGVRRAGGEATIGRPLANERAYILDDRLQPVPIGVTGELFIAGDKVARGYLNRPDLTREKFVEAPFAPGERMYRTGDCARFNVDGTIQFLGRQDHQVKIRGYRIELGEVEAAIRTWPQVTDAVVVARPDSMGGSRLIAYVSGPVASDPRECREHLASRLPAYMIPAQIVAMPELPRLPSGKVDRRALPEPGVPSATNVPPRTTTEEILASVWNEVLGPAELSVHDNFFESGGHSLLAAQVIARIQEFFGVQLSLGQFFLTPTIAGLGVLVEHALITEIQAEGTDLADSHGEEVLSTKERT